MPRFARTCSKPGCGRSTTLPDVCGQCAANQRIADQRAERRLLPIPQYAPDRTDEEEAEAAARVAELLDAERDVERLSAAATESLRRHLDRRGTSPL